MNNTSAHEWKNHETPIHEMSNLELHIGAAIEYLDNDANIEAALSHLYKSRLASRQATQLISKIGTTGVERTEIIQMADLWPKNFL